MVFICNAFHTNKTAGNCFHKLPTVKISKLSLINYVFLRLFQLKITEF